MASATINKKVNTKMSDKNTKSTSNGYSKLVIEKMIKQADEKLDSLKSFSPVLLTIITSVLAVLVTQDLSYDLLLFAICIVGYLLICLGLIVLAYFPQKRYISNSPQRVNHIRVIFKSPNIFEPWNISSYMGLTDSDFIIKLQVHLEKKLSLEELLLAQFLKQKVNEYAYKRKILSFSYVVIIVGALILGWGCVILGSSQLLSR